jgi:hypothetical protein
VTSRRCAAWVLGCTAAFGIGAFVRGGAAATGQLADRPLTGALAHPAIGYDARPTGDMVADLGRRISDGSARIAFEESTGYLRPVLAALQVPIDSQMLVMSKTGIQGLHTSPDNPRAIFFNDAVTVGYIRGAPLLELAVQDPQQGVVFYVLEQKPQALPMFERRNGCLTCHQGYSTLHVPGMVARSVFIAPDGLPLSQFGSFDPDDRTPFRQRWGGWYVTGTHGTMRHMGNAIVTDPANRDAMISDRTLNRTALDGLFDARGYLSAHSDIAALMVFQHQVRMMNLMTRIGWEARIAAHGGRIELTAGALRDGIDELVDSLLFVDEAPLAAKVAGTTAFAAAFSAQGPSDRKGRSLRQLDLEHRLLRYPCSYMVYSAAFSALPADVRAAIYARMWTVLSGRDTQEKYARLAEADRRAVVEILQDARIDLPGIFSQPF